MSVDDFKAKVAEVKKRLNKDSAKTEGGKKALEVQDKYYGDPRLRNEEKVNKRAEEYKSSGASTDQAKNLAIEMEDSDQAERLYKRAKKAYTREAMKKRGVHEVFELAYSDLSERTKHDILKAIIEKTNIQEGFINESEEVTPMVNFIDTLVHSGISEEALEEVLDLSFESFSGEEVQEITEKFIELSVRRAIDSILEDTSPEHRAKREEQRKTAAANVMTTRAQDVLSKDVNTKRLIKGSEEERASARAKKRFDAARGIVKPTLMDKLKGAATKVYKNVKGKVEKTFAEKPEAHDIALDMLRKRYPDPLPSAPKAQQVPKTKAKKQDPGVQSEQMTLDLGTDKKDKKQATNAEPEPQAPAPKVKVKKQAPKNVKIDVPKTEETSDDAKAEKKELAKEYTKETSKAKPNEEKVNEIINKTKKAENKEGFLRQEEKVAGTKEAIKISSKGGKEKPQEFAKVEKVRKEEAPGAQEPAKAEKLQEAPKTKRTSVIKINSKSEKPLEPTKVEEAPKAQEPAKVEKTKEEKVPTPQESADKEKFSAEDRKIMRELEKQKKDKEVREAKDRAADEKEYASLKGSTNSRDIKRRDELKAKLNPKSENEKEKLTDEQRDKIIAKRDNLQKKIEKYSTIDTPQAKARVEIFKKYLNNYNVKLGESLVEALNLLEASLSKECFFEVLEMITAEPKSKADKFKEMMAEKHII